MLELKWISAIDTSYSNKEKRKRLLWCSCWFFRLRDSCSASLKALNFFLVSDLKSCERFKSHNKFMQSSDIKLSKIQNIGHSYPQPTERHFSLVMKRRTNLTFTKIHSKLAWLNEKQCSMKKIKMWTVWLSICLLNRKNCFFIIFIEWQFKKKLWLLFSPSWDVSFIQNVFI